jgi:hypothetical protein
MRKWLGGIAAAVLTGVLTWWLTQGLRFKSSTPQPVPADVMEHTPAPAGVGACADGASPDHGFHNTPAANGSWDWDCNGTVERQWGACENLGSQCPPPNSAPRRASVDAPHGFCSELRGPAGCTPQIAECGRSGWTYPCVLSDADGRCHAGWFETATVMACR